MTYHPGHFWMLSIDCLLLVFIPAHNCKPNWRRYSLTVSLITQWLFS